MELIPKLDRDEIRTVISLLPQTDLLSILKIDDESFDMLKFIKSVALKEISKTFEKGNMLNIQLGSIPTMDLNNMFEFQKSKWCRAVICKVRNKHCKPDLLCRVHLLHHKELLEPGADETILIKVTEPKWLPCYCHEVGYWCHICTYLTELQRAAYE